VTTPAEFVQDWSEKASTRMEKVLKAA